jgi:hypothetical protein
MLAHMFALLTSAAILLNSNISSWLGKWNLAVGYQINTKA